MTIPFGRRRLILTLALVPPSRPTLDGDIPPGTTDLDLARLARRAAVDLDRPRLDALTLMYGGHRQP